MSLHITTGNKLDVVLEWEGDFATGGYARIGLKRWDTEEVIPLSNPRGLIRVLEDALERQMPGKYPK